MKHHKKAISHLKKAHEALAKMHEMEGGYKANMHKKHRMAESHGMKKAMTKHHRGM